MRVAAGIYSLFLLFVLASNSPAQTNWRNEWEKLVKAAKEEGRLTIYGVTVFEDVFKYLGREIKRGSRYDAIVLDPPSFGRGAQGDCQRHRHLARAARRLGPGQDHGPTAAIACGPPPTRDARIRY